MRLVHYPSDRENDGSGTVDDPSARSASVGGTSPEGQVLATDVDLAESAASQTLGLMFRRSLPEDYALVFRFETARTRIVHMLFVVVPIDAVWVVDGVARRVERLRPWRGIAREECDLLVELPAGAGSGIDPGDRLVLEDS